MSEELVINVVPGPFNSLSADDFFHLTMDNLSKAPAKDADPAVRALVYAVLALVAQLEQVKVAIDGRH